MKHDWKVGDRCAFYQVGSTKLLVGTIALIDTDRNVASVNVKGMSFSQQVHLKNLRKVKLSLRSAIAKAPKIRFSKVSIPNIALRLNHYFIESPAGIEYIQVTPEIRKLLK